jgi:hypothetical protein
MQLDSIKLEPLLDTLHYEKINDDVYFNNEIYKKRISNSRLSLLNPKQGGSPEKFFEGFKPSFNPSFAIGSAVHEQLLQPELFLLAENTNKPTAKLGGIADFLYDIYCQSFITNEDVIKASNHIDYYKNSMNEDRIKDIINKCKPYWENRRKYELNLNENREIRYLDASMLEKAKGCINSAKNNKQLMSLLHPEGILQPPISACEEAILLDIKATTPKGDEIILNLKSKLDNYTIDLETNTIIVNDVKTHGNLIKTFKEASEKYHYYREIAMYIFLLNLVAQKFYNLNNPKMQANYLVISTVPNYYSKVFPITINEIRKGFHEFKTLLRYVVYLICYKNYSFI